MTDRFATPNMTVWYQLLHWYNEIEILFHLF